MHLKTTELTLAFHFQVSLDSSVIRIRDSKDFQVLSNVGGKNETPS